MIINSATLLGLRTNLKTSFQNAFTGTTTNYQQVSMTVNSDTDTETYGWMGDLPQIREWLGDRQIKNLKTYDYAIKNKMYELTIGVNANDIKDNKLSGYGITATDMGMKAAKFPDTLIWAVVKAGNASLCYDGQYFFDTDHPVGTASVSNSLSGAATPWYLLDLSGAVKPFVLQLREQFEFVALDSPTDPNVFFKNEFNYGIKGRMNAGYGLWQMAIRSAATLDEAGYDAAKQAMMAFTGDTGDLLGLRPTHIVVPPSLELTARKLLTMNLVSAGQSNPLYNDVQIIVAPRLG